MTAEEIRSTTLWARVADYLASARKENIEIALRAIKEGNAGEAAMAAGRVEQIDETLGLPDWIFSNDRASGRA